MISFARALSTIRKNTHRLPIIRRALNESSGYFLAETITARFDVPRFDNSSVDGYGVRTHDLLGASRKCPVMLRLVGEVRAGETSALRLRPGDAIRLFTGARIPSGVETVVIREDVGEGKAITFTNSVTKGENVRPRGMEFEKGEALLLPHSLITPAVVGLIASTGRTHCRVYRKPTVRIILTGDEIVPAGTPLRPSDIYDSVGPSLSAMCTEFGITDCAILRSHDGLPDLKRKIQRALKQADVLITVGGISVGDYDLVRAALESSNVHEQYWRVAIKPGKPNYFGLYNKKTHGSTLVFGLPGNPVSALVSFHLLVKVALLKMIGSMNETPIRFTARLTSPIRRDADRFQFIRGKASVGARAEWQVSVVRGQESHMLGGLAKANCLIHIPSGAGTISAGGQVLIEMLSSGGVI